MVFSMLRPSAHTTSIRIFAARLLAMGSKGGEFFPGVQFSPTIVR